MLRLLAELCEALFQIRFRRRKCGALPVGLPLHLRERVLRLRELAPERVPLRCQRRVFGGRVFGGCGPGNFRPRPRRLVQFAQHFLVLRETPLQSGLQRGKSRAFFRGFAFRLGQRVFQRGLRLRELRLLFIRHAGSIRHLVADLREAIFQIRLRCAERRNLTAERVLCLGEFPAARFELRLDRGLVLRRRAMRVGKRALHFSQSALQLIAVGRQRAVFLRGTPLLLRKGILHLGETTLQFRLFGGERGVFLARALQPIRERSLRLHELFVQRIFFRGK